MSVEIVTWLHIIIRYICHIFLTLQQTALSNAKPQLMVLELLNPDGLLSLRGSVSPPSHWFSPQKGSCLLQSDHFRFSLSQTQKIAWSFVLVLCQLHFHFQKFSKVC